MRSVCLYFLLWVKDLVIFELRFGFLMQNSIYGQMETLGIHQMGLRTLKIHFLKISSTINKLLDLQILIWLGAGLTIEKLIFNVFRPNWWFPDVAI